MSSTISSSVPVSGRYTAVAILFHWAIAAAILGNLALGWWMQVAIDNSAERGRAVAAFQIHKSIGLTVLGLSMLRILWRLLHRPPAFAQASSVWVHRAVHTMHWLFYVLMLALPLSGWLYVSTQWRGHGPMNVPTLWFSWLEVPHLLSLNKLAVDQRGAIAASMVEMHIVLSWTLGGMLLLHVLGAFKHHFIPSESALRRMLPLASRKERLTAIGSLVVITALALLVLLTLLRIPSAQADLKAPVQPSSPVVEVAPAPIVSEPEKRPPVIEKSTGNSDTATSWSVDPAKSKVTYSGTHAGVPFEGKFTRWKADIKLLAGDPSHSRLTATFETASATDGIALHDESLPQTEWFDAANHPSITFTSTRVLGKTNGAFSVEGYLTIKDHKLPVPAMALTTENGHLLLSGEFKVSRKAADLGMESDPDANWVSPDITVKVSVEGTQPTPK